MKRNEFIVIRHKRLHIIIISIIFALLMSFIIANNVSARLQWQNTQAFVNQNNFLAYMPHQVYEVEKGKTLSQITSMFHIKSSTLLSVNDLNDVNDIRAGLKLVIPQENGILYRLRWGDSYSSVARYFSISEAEIREVNQIEQATSSVEQYEVGYVFLPNVLPSKEKQETYWNGYFSWPVYGSILEDYGDSIDYYTRLKNQKESITFKVNSTNNSVWAPFDGFIEKISIDPYYGRYIVINHENGYKTMIGNVRNIQVYLKDKVSRFMPIAEADLSPNGLSFRIEFLTFQGDEIINPHDIIR